MSGAGYRVDGRGNRANMLHTSGQHGEAVRKSGGANVGADGHLLALR